MTRGYFQNLDAAAAITAGILTSSILCLLVHTSSGLTTCGEDFFVPAFPECDLFVEVVPCINLTVAVIVSIATTEGKELYNFSVLYGEMKELRLQRYNPDRHEGLTIRSSGSVSLYLHTSLGDSMVVYPVETYAKAYVIPRLDNELSEDYSSSSSSSTASPTESSSAQALHHDLHANLFIFSPYKANVFIEAIQSDGLIFSYSSSTLSPSSSSSSLFSTTTKISPSASLSSSSKEESSTTPTASPSSSTETSSSSSSFTSVQLEAFILHQHVINTTLVYRLYSDSVFGLVLIQSPDAFSHNHVICKDVSMRLLDFVPPFLDAGKMHYLAFYDETDFSLFVKGAANSSVDIVTDASTQQLRLDMSGSSFIHLSSVAAAWVSSAYPVTIYTRLTVCNISHDSVDTNNTNSTQAPTTHNSEIECAENGFFLPAVESYFHCYGNLTSHEGESKDSHNDEHCACHCPSVFQRDFRPSSFFSTEIFALGSNASESIVGESVASNVWSRPATSKYPLLVGDLFGVSTSVAQAVGFKDAWDIMVNTNNSYLVFRHDFVNLNYLPAGLVFSNNGLSLYCDVDNTENKVLVAAESFLNTACHSSRQNESSANISLTNSCTCSLTAQYEAPLISSDTSVGRDSRRTQSTAYETGPRSSVVLRNSMGNYPFWGEDDEDRTRPLIAVIVSLCVAIFAVVALISGYMLVELVSRRKKVRNTKIRPFVS